MKKLILFIALIIPISLLAQTFKYSGKSISYTKKADTIKVSVNDANKTVLKFVGFTAMPTATQVLAEYNRVINIPKPPVSDVKTISYVEYANLSNVSDKKYKVIPGVYKQGVYHENLVNVDFDLTGVTVQDLNNSALTIAGKSINVSYRNATFKNVNAYQINCYNSDKVVYNGSTGTYIDRLKIDGFTFDGGGSPFHEDGNVVSKGVFNGVMKGFVFSNNTIQNNLASANMVYASSCVDAEIFGNKFININKNNNNDNGLIFLKGSGKIYKNIATDYQGYLARIWLFSIDGQREVLFSNNIGAGNRKYGLVEFQMPDVIKNQGAEPANAKIYNNTALNLNTSNDWAAMLLTLYNTYGNVDYYNNLGAQLVGIKDNRATRDYNIINDTSMVFKMNGKETILNISGQNLYFDKVSDAVNDNLTSKHNGIGAVQ